jgi:hypothetical protein
MDFKSVITSFSASQDITSDKKATPDELSAANLAILYGMAKHRQRKEAWIYYEMTKVCPFSHDEKILP